MASQSEPEIVLFDLTCNQGTCFSPVVWRIRLMLNYKQIPYKTIFLEFPDIEPTLKGLGLVPSEAAKGRYTVPTIYHVPTKTYLMDSVPIAQFIESTYPTPAVPFKSDLGLKIEAQARANGAVAFRNSLMPREINILPPRSQEFFRRTREAALGHPLEDLLDAEKEEQAWKDVDERMKAVSDLMQTNKAEGPFVLGAKPSLTDFFIAGSLQCARMVDEAVWERSVRYAGYRGIYEACLPWMEKND